MAKAKNKVISGDYLNQSVRNDVSWTESKLVIGAGKDTDFFKTTSVVINKDTVEDYEVLSETQSKSASSTMLRAGAGALVLGPVGLLAGVSGKTKGIYNVAIVFKDGKKSLIEIDEKLYKELIKIMF